MTTNRTKETSEGFTPPELYAQSIPSGAYSDIYSLAATLYVLLPKTLTSTGNAGNYGFAPYEQITKGSREPTVDVYCLAATLYYAVTGQNPTTSIDRKLYKASLTPPKQIFPGISDKLNKAILKGMALEAKDRPQSMGAWLKMLEAPIATPPRIIPWGWLIYVLLSYLFVGNLLALSNAAYIVWAVAVAVAVAVGEADAVLVAVGVAVTGPDAVLVAVAVALGGAGAVVVGGAVGGNKLRKYENLLARFIS